MTLQWVHYFLQNRLSCIFLTFIQAANEGMPKTVPTYYGFRIYFTANVLYFFLVIPFLLFMIGMHIPDLAEQRGWMDAKDQTRMDSLAQMADSLAAEGGEEHLDELINGAIEAGKHMEEGREESEKAADELAEQGKAVKESKFEGPVIQVSTGEETENESLLEEKGALNRFFKWLFFLTLASYVGGLIYNIRIKRYFKEVRKQKPGGEKNRLYTRKHLRRTPVINALMVTSPSIVVLIYSLFFILLPGDMKGALEKETFVEFFFLAILATLLQYLFVYYWQKHRVQIKYLDHVFGKEELRQRLQEKKGGKIRDRLLVASFMTTFLPLLIVFSYMIQSLTRIKDLTLESLNPESWEILMGPWGALIGDNKDAFTLDQVQWMVYVNATESLIMIIGMLSGVLVSLLYLWLFIRWTNHDLTVPIKELLAQMRNTRGGGVEQYATVRTNDEIGELAEGYNEMTRKIHEHMDHIFTLNRDLEQKVEDRTQEVVMQKEEIEAQKEEIQTQLDMVTSQRDTISSQKDLILDSIHYAEKIQSALMPPEMHMKEVLDDHFILYKPRDIVSGDYYWSAFAHGKLLVAAADCTGHGVPGAFLSVMGISSMNELVSRSVAKLSAHQMLADLRDYIIHSLHQTGSRGEANDGIEIALCMIDPVNMTLEFAGANRPLYLVRRKPSSPEEYEISVVKGDRMPIGIYEQENRPFTSHHLDLKKDDRIYLFSDGYTDQLGGPKRKTFRAIHFRKLLLDLQKLSMEEQKKALMEKHLEWRGEVDQIDDILVLGLRM